MMQAKFGDVLRATAGNLVIAVLAYVVLCLIVVPILRIALGVVTIIGWLVKTAVNGAMKEYRAERARTKGE